MSVDKKYDVIVVGGGLSGMATAMLLQNQGNKTLLLEAHSRLGGCAGFYRRDKFSFDIGATTLVDFNKDGVGGNFLQKVGLQPIKDELLPGYMAWLPDRRVEVASDNTRWQQERLKMLGDSNSHRRFWNTLDEIADTYWQASRSGLKMPMRSFSDMYRNWKALDFKGLMMSPYLFSSMGDLLRKNGLQNDRPLVGLLSMMIEDTVHAKVDSAPLINSALGVTIRGAGLARPVGGMRGFWRQLAKRYVEIGGTIKLNAYVNQISGKLGSFSVRAKKNKFQALQVVSALPIQNTAKIASHCIGKQVRQFIERDNKALGGGIVVCIGVPENQVINSPSGHRHHQLLQSYERDLGNGNNMFISISAEEDTLSAPEGFRSVMISTHCELDEWKFLNHYEYRAAKKSITKKLITYARRVYPALGETYKVLETGTPRTYKLFTDRFGGSIGGARLSMQNANQRAVPYDLATPGLWMVGDTTWPGLGTVACVIGASHVSEGVMELFRDTKLQVRSHRKGLVPSLQL